MLGWFIFAVAAIFFILAGAIFISTKDPSKTQMTLFVFSAIACLGFFIAGCWLSAVDHAAKTTTRGAEEGELVAEYVLRSMDNTSSISGGGMGAGGFAYATLSTNDTYQFLFEREDGGIEKVSIPTNDLILYELEEGSSETPRLEEWSYVMYEITTVDESQGKYFRPFWRDLKPVFETKEELLFSFSDAKSYKAYIPAGSIVSMFNVMG